MRDGDLTLQARRSEDPQLLQFVPSAVFVGDFPKTFVDDYVHWLDLGTGEVEFRPVESPWTPDPSNWRLSVGTQSLFRKIYGDGAAPVDLIDIHSGTFQMISHLLSALESPENITVTRTNDHALEASLTRLHLVFFVNQDSEWECRNMPGYVIDEYQSCGTMFGLENQLVLRPSDDTSEMPRRVVIPQGDIEFSLDGDFASVSIKTGTARHVHWHDYTIDTDLGRLAGNISLHSKLYQCYLHALTSHCLPDPLLGHTGTEESLNMLQSATFLSFQRLGKDDAKLLDLIGALTPIRAYYPPHLKTMVTVTWNNLPIFSQHHDFHPAVLSILDHAHAMEALYNNAIVFETPRRVASLLTRTASRNKAYYPRDLQCLRHSPSSTSEDVAYKSRDGADGRGAEHAAYLMSWSVWNDRPRDRNIIGLWDAMQSWRSLGPAAKEISLRYSRYWLTFDAAKDWLCIYDICQKAINCDRQDSKISLAFSLSAASFSQSDYADFIPLIQIFATDTRLRGYTSPSPSYYDLSDGLCPDYERLAKLISQFALPLVQTLPQAMGKQAIGVKKPTKKERQREYNNSISNMTSTTARSIVEQWPRRPFDLPSQWFDTQACRKSVDVYLESISRNIILRDHIHSLQAIIDCYEVTIPPDTPYLFSPRFSTRPPNAMSHSLREVLMSRANFAQSPIYREHNFTIPSTATIRTEGKPPSSREDNLSCLIHEFRRSPEPLLQLYGEDLSKSRRDLLEKAVPSPVHSGVPSQGLLRYYRDLCSIQKGAIFSELSEALAPSQKLESVIGVSGIWPRITPRSILRELSRDRVHTLTDQWKYAITRYAVAFLKYQQSQRLLDLSSRHRDEELLREAETVCEDVTADCSPDWLLIQVSYPYQSNLQSLTGDIVRSTRTFWHDLYN